LTYFYTHFLFFLALLFNLFYYPIALFIHLYLQEGNLNKVSILELKSAVLTIFVILLATFFIAILFFIFFPRLNQPLFQVGVEKKAKTGFTEAIRLGEVSQIQESSAKVLRLELSKPIPPSELYLRVIVYDYFDGRTWRRSFNPSQIKDIPVIKGFNLSGTIYLEIPQGDFLPVAEAPIFSKAHISIVYYADYTSKTAFSEVYPLKYKFQFSLTKEKPALEKDLSPYLQLPDVSPKIKEIAESLKGETPGQTALNIYKYLTSSPFSYSTTALPISSSPLTDFLLRTKKGNCEYFAGAMAVLLRLNGIPSRVVGGYHGAIYQSMGDYYIVEERFAHAWVEAYLNGKWVLFDPTPQRGARPYEKLSLGKKLLLILDLINYHYTKAILDYNFGKQKILLSSAKEIFAKVKIKQIPKIPSISSLKSKAGLWILWLVGGILLLALMAKLIFLCIKPREKRLLDDFFKILKKAGFERRKNQGLVEFVDGLPEGEVKHLACEFVKIYQSSYYKDRKFTKGELDELAYLLRRLKERVKKKGQY